MKSVHGKSTVFILGAGASSAAGAPLMNTFFHAGDTFIQEGRVGWAIEYFENVFGARRALQTACAKSYIDIDNLESIFSCFEMACLVEQLGTLDLKIIRQLPESLTHRSVS
jgi:hypothetical protein